MKRLLLVMPRFILMDLVSNRVVVITMMVLHSLGYLLETEADVAVQNIRGKDTGQLSVAIYPTSDGIVIDDDMLDDPSEMVGQEGLGCKVVVKCLKVSPVSMITKIIKCRGFPGE